MEPDQKTLAFGRRLKAQRHALGLTQAELAALVGCAPITIQKIEQGRRKPSQRLSERLMLELDIPPVERPAFLAESQQEQPPPKIGHGNVLVTADGLVGREAELGALATLLSGSGRLTTVTGAAGTGKTRLALALAMRMHRRFAHGSCFVDLTGVTAAAHVLPAIAAALQVTAAPAQLPRVLAETMAPRHGLLILDGFDGVLPAGPQIASLLQAAPRLHVLVTSRERLRLAEEQQYALGVLRVPEAGDDLETLEANPAVQLLAAAARARQPHFSLTAKNGRGIAAICRQLGGLPLALELVGAGMGDSDPETVAVELAGRLRAPGSTLGKQSSAALVLRAAVEWSTERLAPWRRQALARLAVFAGGFTRPAAAYVLQEQEDGSSRELAEESLQHLLQAAFVTRDPAAARPHYNLPEALRPFALAQLAADGTEAAARRRHAHFFARLAAQARAAQYTADMPRWQRRLAGEQENIRSALAWCRDGDPTLGLALAADMGALWELWGHCEEGTAWLAAFLERARAADGPWARALQVQGRLLSGSNHPAQARAAYAESLAICRRLNDTRGMAQALIGTAETLDRERQYSRSKPIYQEVLDLLAPLDDGRSLSVALGGLAAHALRAQRDLDEAQRLSEQSVSAARQTQDFRHLAWMLALAADIARERGDLPQAERDVEEALEQFLILGDLEGQACCKLRQGCTRAAVGPPGAARELLLEALRLAWNADRVDYAAQALALIGVLNLRQTAHASGVALIAAAEQLDPQLYARLERTNAATVSAELTAARAQIDPAAIAAHQAAGRAYTLAEAAAVARAAPI